MIPFCILLLAGLPGQTQAVRPAERLDLNNPGPVESVAADQRDGLAAVAWLDASAGGDGLYCSTTSDHGLSWRYPVRVDGDASGADKRLAESGVLVAGGAVFAFWLDDRHGAGTDLFARVSRDGGASWEPEILLDDGGPAGADPVLSFDAAVNADGTGVAVAMVVERAGMEEVRIAVSGDGGLSFSSSQLLALAADAPRLRLRAQGDDLHLAWLDRPAAATVHDVRYQRSLDLGLSWLPTPTDLDGGFAASADSLDLAVRGEGLIAVWQEAVGTLPLRAAFSSVGGALWQVAPNPVGASACSGTVPMRARAHFADGNAVVAWADDRAMVGMLRSALAWTADAGATWTESSLSPGEGADPRVAGDPDSGLLATLWRDGQRLGARVSRAATPLPLPEFLVRTAAGAALRDPMLAHDPLYGDYLAAWIEQDSGGTDHVFAAGFRVPQILPQGDFRAGGLVSFAVSQFGHHEAGWNFKVLAAAVRGSATLPPSDGRRTGLAPDGWYQLSQSQIALGGAIDAAGAGLSPAFNFPASIPPGTTMWFVAVAYQAGPLRFGAITDPRPVPIQ